MDIVSFLSSLNSGHAVLIAVLIGVSHLATWIAGKLQGKDSPSLLSTLETTAKDKVKSILQAAADKLVHGDSSSTPAAPAPAPSAPTSPSK